MAEDGGLVVKGDDGSIYFIRDDILAACKVEGDDGPGLKELVEGSDVEGFAMNLQLNTASPGVQVVGKAVNPQVVNPVDRIDFAKRVRDTVMCPW